MSKRNCPNCGAPYDVELNTCPFCKTSYFDMSCIDFDERKPIFLKIRVNAFGRKACITQRVIPVLENIEFDNEYKDVLYFDGCVSKVKTSANITTNIKFVGVPSDLMYVESFEEDEE